MTESTELAIQPRPSIETGGSVAAFVPQNLDEAFRLATAFHKSGMAPPSLNSPEKVMIAMMAGFEVGLKPFQAVRSIAVINNNPSLWGDGFLAVLRANKFTVNEWMEGDDDNRIAYCEVTRPDTGEVVTRSFSVAQAKKARLWTKSGPWQDYPERMLQMRARGFAGRDAGADVLKGLPLAEEVMDTPVTPPKPQTVALKPTAADLALTDESETPPPEIVEQVNPADEHAPDGAQEPQDGHVDAGATQMAETAQAPSDKPAAGIIAWAIKNADRAASWENIEALFVHLETEKTGPWEEAVASGECVRVYEHIRGLPIWEDGTPMDKHWVEIKKALEEQDA